MTQFLKELKRRKVFRVAIVYLVSAWLIMQVADVLAPVLELPDWAAKLVFFLLLIGFVPALILAWAYEVTPEGIKRETGDAAVADRKPGAGQYFEHALVGILVVALLGAGGYWFMGRDARWAKNEAYPRIEKHADAGEWEQD